MIPLIKTDFSIGKSIIQLGPLKDGEMNKPDQPSNVVDLVKKHNWNKVFVLEDHLGGFYPLYYALKDTDCNLCYGYRVTVVDDAARLEPQNGSKVGIFVRNEAGWKILIKLATLAQVDYFHKEPRLDWKTIKEHWTDDLVLTICFYDGFIHKNVFTKENSIPNFGGLKPYMFLEDNDVFFDGELRRKTLEYAKAFNLETIEVKSCYYEYRSDLIYFQARKLMDRRGYGGGNVEVPNLEYFNSPEFCVESALEKEFDGGSFAGLFDEKLNLFLPGVRLPEFLLDPTDKEHYNIPDGATDGDVLRILTTEGYKNKLEGGEIDTARTEEYLARIERELKVLDETSFVPYILLVWDVMRFARKNNLAYGFGRGSSAGSLVNWLLGITDIDPILGDLYFERFISTTRAKAEVINGVTYIKGALMDIDLDFGAESRDMIVDYLAKKYEGRFAKLSTYGTETTVILIKDAGKILGLFSEDDIKLVSGEIPVRFGKVASPEKAYEESEKFRDFCDANPLVFNCAKKLQELIRNFSSHASAYLISYDPLSNFIPLQYGKDNEIVTSCNADASEKSIIKLDLLGLQSVTLLDKVVKSIGINPATVDYDSWDNIYVHLQDLKCPSNLFQLGDAALRGLQKIKPRDMAALSDVLAICRPGSFIFIDPYAAFYNGEADKVSLHPLFDEILAKSSGVLLYQETLMALFTKIGFNLAEADDIRRIVGKKKVAEIAQWEEKIYAKGRENNIDPKACEVLWKLALASADYSFNKCILPSTIVTTKDRGSIMMSEVIQGEEILCFNTETKEDHYQKVVDIFENEVELFEVEFEDGKIIKCSLDHKLLCEDMVQRPLKEVVEKGYKIITA